MGTYSALMDQIRKEAKKLDETGKLDQMVNEAGSSKAEKVICTDKTSTQKKDK